MTNESRQHATELLGELKRVIEDEQRLFGDVLLFEIPAATTQTQATAEVEPLAPLRPEYFQHPKVSVSTKRIELVREKAEEPSLFELPNPVRPITAEEWGGASSLVELNNQICECQKCALGSTRTKFVFGVGNPKATLMFIGEAPGADEDAQGEPFVGRAGQLLTKIIEAINFKRSDVYICNILKCRPPNNRKPSPEESELCKPYLKKQIALVKPRVIVCLGLTAAENLLGTRESMGKLRGRVLEYEGVPVMVTYHPAALLRNPNWKRPTWEDVQVVRKLHDELVGKS